MSLRNKTVLGALVIAVTLLLAACGQQTPPAVDAGSVTLTLAIAEDALSGQSLSPLGAPFDPATGATAIETLHVTVRNGSDVVVMFDRSANTYTANPNGSLDHVTLAKGGSGDGLESVNVVLPLDGNQYTFESLGYANMADPVIAYASQTANVSNNSTVWLRPVSVIGAASLATRFPTTYVAPNSIVDLMLVVTANGHPDLQVPLGDFEATYQVSTDATQLSSSNRGLRIQVDSACVSGFEVSSTVTGLVDSATGFDSGSVAASLDLDCPPMVDGGVAYDSEAPTVSLTSYSPLTGLVVGNADDNFGIAKVQIFDGPELVASTDEDDTSASVSLIAFINGTTEFRTSLLTAPLGGISAFAFDATGHQASTVELASPSRVYVDDDATGPSDGSEANPFSTIAEALAFVADGGTIVVAAGDYAEQVLIGRNVTLEGAGVGATVIHAPATLAQVEGRYPLLEVAGSNVTAHVSGVELRGPFPTGCALFGVSVVDGTLHLSDSAVVDARFEPLSGTQCGIGIQVGRNADGYAGTANLTNVAVSGFQKGGIVADGAGSALFMAGGSVTGAGSIDVTAQNGIQVSRGATAEIEGVAISSMYYSPPNWGATGLLVYEAGAVRIDGVTFDGNQTAIGIQGTPAGVTIVNSAFNTFGPLTETYFLTTIGSAPVDLSGGNTFDGRSPSSMTLEQLIEVEERIYHAVDHAAYDLVTLVPGQLFVGGLESSVQLAVDVASPGTRIRLAPDADFTAQGSVTVHADKPHLTIEGNGASVRSLIIAAADVTVEDLIIETDQATSTTAGVQVAATGVTLRDVAISNSIDFEAAGLSSLGHGIFIPVGTNASGLVIEDVSVSNVTYGLYADTSAANPTSLEGIRIDGLELSDITWKGIYLESLQGSVIRNVNMANVGWFGGGRGTGLNGRWGTGIDLNLKYGDYSDIRLEGIIAANTGWSHGTGTDSDIRIGDLGTDSDPNGVVLTIKARNDGTTYGANPASVTGVVIDGLTVTDSLVGLRFGEPGRDNEHSEVVVRNSTVTAPTRTWTDGATSYSVYNATVSDVDATDNNTFDEPIWDGSDDPTRGVVELK